MSATPNAEYVCEHCGLPVEWWQSAYRSDVGLWRHVGTAAERCLLYAEPPTKSPAPCVDHKPVQHRDLKPPWCNACGLTANFQEPAIIYRGNDA